MILLRVLLRHRPGRWLLDAHILFLKRFKTADWEKRLSPRRARSVSPSSFSYLLERSFKSIRSRSAAQSVAGCHLSKLETRVSGKSRLPPQLFTGLHCEFFWLSAAAHE